MLSEQALNTNTHSHRTRCMLASCLLCRCSFYIEAENYEKAKELVVTQEEDEAVEAMYLAKTVALSARTLANASAHASMLMNT
eukprot:6197432-Pleurochrysis_carterae.AAC.2